MVCDFVWCVGMFLIMSVVEFVLIFVVMCLWCVLLRNLKIFRLLSVFVSFGVVIMFWVGCLICCLELGWISCGFVNC